MRKAPTLSGLTGKLYTAFGAAIGFTVANGIYVTIDASNHELLILAAAVSNLFNRSPQRSGTSTSNAGASSRGLANSLANWK